jgi:hypothetical protein
MGNAAGRMLERKKVWSPDSSVTKQLVGGMAYNPKEGHLFIIAGPIESLFIPSSPPNHHYIPLSPQSLLVSNRGARDPSLKPAQLPGSYLQP